MTSAATLRPGIAPPPVSPAAKRAGAFIAILLHFAAGAWLLTYEPARTALFEAAPILVEFITPPQPKLEPPKPLPAAPRPVAKPVVAPPAQPTILSMPQEVVAPAASQAPPPPVVVAPPPPVITPAVVSAAPPAPPAPPAPVTPPQFNAAYLDNPAPAYPAASRRFGEQGRVLLRVLVSAAGRAEEIQIQTSSRYARLDEAARDAVRRWRFVPAKRGAEPLAGWVLIPISFKVDD